METLRSFIIVGCGSFLGGGLRYLLSKLIASTPEALMPYATFSANMLGCLLIGVFYGLFEQEVLQSPSLRLFLTVGLCGGLTTFSTFMNENVQLVRNSDISHIAFYVIASLLCGFFAIIAGNWIVKSV